MQYTREQLTKLWDYFIEVDDKQNKIEEWFAVMFEDQYRPFINYFSLVDIIKILDQKLYDTFIYVWYECKSMKNGWKIVIWEKEYNIEWTVDWFIKHCEIEGLLIK